MTPTKDQQPENSTVNVESFYEPFEISNTLEEQSTVPSTHPHTLTKSFVKPTSHKPETSAISLEETSQMELPVKNTSPFFKKSEKQASLVRS